MECKSTCLLTACVLILGTLALTNATLTSVSANEGGCLSPPSTTDVADYVFIFSYTGVWNIPMASQYLYRRYAEILRGYSAADETDLASMDLTGQCTTLACSISGYSKDVNQVCVPTTYSLSDPALVTQFTCPAVLGSTATSWGVWGGYLPPLNYNYPPQISVLWTDLNNTIILSQCLDGAYRAFAVFSKSATLDSATQTTVNGILTGAGYDSDYFQFL